MKATFDEDSTLPYFGKNYRFKIIQNHNEKKDNIELVNGEFLISFVNSRYSKKRIKRLYEAWLTQQAQQIFEEKIKKYSEELEVKPQQIIIKNLKKR